VNNAPVVSFGLKHNLKSATYQLLASLRSFFYLKSSSRRLKAKYPFFSESWYVGTYPELGSAKEPPIEHYFGLGWQERREPHYLFWADWYRQKYLPTNFVGDPLVHFLEESVGEKQAPHPLFHSVFYRSQLDELNKTEGQDLVIGQLKSSELWVDYLQKGAFKRFSPHPLFSPSFYAEQLSDPVADQDLFRHYLEVGYLTGLSPSRDFDEVFYRAKYPDVGDSGMPGLLHYEIFGSREGRFRSAAHELEVSQGQVLLGLGVGAGHLSFRMHSGSSEELGLQRVTMLIPRLSSGFLTGGPNTALAFIGLLAIALSEPRSVPVRVIATDDLDLPLHEVKSYVETLVGRKMPADFSIEAKSGQRIDALDHGEVFIATTWSTMNALDAAGLVSDKQKPIYLIQDFEAAFYPESTTSLLARQSYQLPHRAVVNTPWLADFLHQEGVGLFSSAAHRAEALTFWPAINQEAFVSKPIDQTDKSSNRKTLVFYARPTTAPRNLYELGLAALRRAHRQGAFDNADWRFVAVGDSLPPTLIAPNTYLESVPWVSFADYAKTIGSADVMLSLMASPHPSYPPIEASVAGAVVVTNTWQAKTKEQLENLLPGVYAVEPTQVALADALVAAAKTPRRAISTAVQIDIPRNWQDSLSQVILTVSGELRS